MPSFSNICWLIFQSIIWFINILTLLEYDICCFLTASDNEFETTDTNINKINTLIVEHRQKLIKKYRKSKA